MAIEELVRLAEKIGLTNYEARAYIALLIHGSLTATELAKKGEIPQPRIYDVTKSLEAKGLIVTSEGRPRRFTIVDPGIALRKLVEKRYQEELLSIQEIVEQSSMIGRTSEEPGVWTATGPDAVENLVISSLKSARNEILVSGFSEFVKRYVSEAKLENIASCLVLYDENYNGLVELFDEVRVRPTRAPQFVITDFSMVTAVVNWGTQDPVAYRVTDMNLMKIFAVYYLSYLRAGAKIVSSKFDKVRKRTYHHLTRALDHLKLLEEMNRKAIVTVKGRWIKSGESAYIRGVPQQVYENSFKGIGTLIIVTEDGKKVTVGGIDAYLEDIEGFEITIETT
ncbi:MULTISPECIES: TrmB family transcriptional regulator [Thermofilum]|uniref:TrmB family transcriptional regulator n=2 Tax=Thermofilum adornatum TaxID=1365176 RepID=S6A5X4_9CREN|nr:TrmB family transcriptional regulator sugar-binding domain-containing protein [Thermofilum adornatum]AGT35832.1 hypothetical protein N186_07470 [Thermofilum adornatum]AJB41633.1 Transcriptional regulator, TrmB family [Thermofilum adornatum 1505]